MLSISFGDLKPWHSCYFVSSGVPIQKEGPTAEAYWGAAKGSGSASSWHTRSHPLDIWPCWTAAVIRWCFHWGRCADQRHTLHPYREIHLYTGTCQNLFTQTDGPGFPHAGKSCFVMLENFIHAMENNSDMTVLLTRLFSKCRHFGTTAMTKLARHGNVPEMCAKSSIKRNMCLKLFFVLSEKQSANMPHLYSNFACIDWL